MMKKRLLYPLADDFIQLFINLTAVDIWQYAGDSALSQLHCRSWASMR